MLFYLASIIIHDLFRTDHANFGISQTSSYLDLAPLYGSNQEEQNLMRTFKDGELKPDCFSEQRLLGFPPGVGALLIMFNRFHNNVVKNLAAINEGGRFRRPKSDGSKDDWRKYDEDLFQTGRLVTGGLYVNILIHDYLRTILNLHRTESDWFFDPRQEMNGGAPLGTGNQVSAEFNLVYRWHSCISTKDAKWTEDFYEKLFPGQNPKNLDLHEMIQGLDKLEKDIPEDPKARSLGNLVRGDDGKFKDDDLVEILTSSIEDVAGAFGARRIPTIMRGVEILGIEQARRWNLASLNEFRAYFKLTTYKTFEELNPDPEIATQLKYLYEEVDNVELYPGLVCEEAKPMMLPGSGFATNYTLMRGILADALALIRSDRFCTVDYHPRQLTNWGFAEASSQPTIENGCVFSKLFYTSFPHHFTGNSIYAHHPLTIPSEMKNIFTDLGKAAKYDFSRPKRLYPEVMVSSFEACTQVLGDKDTFNVPWGKGTEFLVGPPAKDFMSSGDGPVNAKSREVVGKALYIDGWESDVKAFYEHTIKQLFTDKAYKLGGVNQVDIIRDIVNLVHVHFCAELFSIPLKTESHPHGIFTEKELYLIMAVSFTEIFFDVEPEQSFFIHQAAHEASQTLNTLISTNVETIHLTGAASDNMSTWLNRDERFPLQHYGVHMIQRLLASANSTKDVYADILGTASPVVAVQGAVCSQAIEYYLLGDGKSHMPEIARLSQLDTPEADEQLKRYLLEASRINCSSAPTRWATKATSIPETNAPAVSIPEGAKVTVNLQAASRDPSAFPDPLTVKLDRPLDSYLQFGYGPHKCIGFGVTLVAMTVVFKSVFAMKNLRPVKGLAGRIAKVESSVPGYYKYLTENWDQFSPFPVCKFGLPSLFDHAVRGC